MALDNVTFASMVSNLASQEYKDRVPTATQDNIANIEEIISTYPTVKNEFINVLTNQVAKQLFFSKAYENPYKLFNRGPLPYGKSVESIYVDIIKAKQRTHETNTTNLASDLLGRETPNVKVEYYSENFQHQYKTTITDEELKGAFRAENGLSSMTGRILQAPLTSIEYDMQEMVLHALPELKGGKATIDKTAYGKMTEEEKAKVVVKTIKSQVIKMGFLNNKHNGQGVMTSSRPQDLVVFLDPDMMANIDVELLAQAFNIEKAEVPLHVLPVPQFTKRIVTPGEGSEESTVTYEEDTDCLAIICDKDAIQIYETLNSSETFRNPQGIYTNVFFNRWGLMSACNFANVCRIVTA